MTVGTFILGLPGEDQNTMNDTIQFAKELDCDYASFNTFVPKPGTLLENRNTDEIEMIDQSGISSIHGYGQLTATEIGQYHRKAIREFYLNPTYVMKRISRVTSFTEFKMHLDNGLFLINEFAKR